MQDYVTVAFFTYPSELAIARSFLEAEGIPCYVRDELTVQVHNFLSNAIGNIRLEVPKTQLEETEQLLWDHGYGNHLAHGDRFREPDEMDRARETILKHLPWILKILLAIFATLVAVAIYIMLK